MNRRVALILKAVVAATILGLVLARVDLEVALRHLRGVSLPMLCVALLPVLLIRVLMAAKWSVLLRQRGVTVGVWALLRIVLVSGFLAMLLPTSLGADALRLVELKRRRHAFAAAASATLADRMLTIIAIVLVSCIAAVLCWDRVSDKTPLWSVFGISIVLSATILAVVSRAPAQLAERMGAVWSKVVEPRLPGLPRGERIEGLGRKALGKALEVHQELRDLAKTPRTIIWAFVLNLLVQLVRVVHIDLVFRSIGVPIPFVYGLAFVPIIILLTLLPISFFGLGIKEAGFVFFFSLVGVAPEACVTASGLTYVVQLVIVLVGALLFATGIGGHDEGREANGT